MPRRESPDEFISSASISSASRPTMAGSDQAVVWGKLAAKLAGYGVATVAFTFMLLRPNRSGKRGSLFFGSGIVVVLLKTLFSADPAPTVPTTPPTTPVLAAATPAAPAPTPSAAPPSRSPPPRKRPHVATAAPPKPAPVAEAAAKKTAPAPVVAVSPPPEEAGIAALAAPPPPAPKAAPAPAPSKPAPVLGPRYSDNASGFSVQFPTGWTPRPVRDGSVWVIDATDGAAAITIGLSKFPAKMSVDEVVPEKVTRGLQTRAGTVVHATGYATIGGRRCLWHKYTGPVSRPGGSAKMTVVHYLLPLRDGRALEVRVAAAPEKFNEAALRMKQSLDSLKLLTPVADSSTARAR